MISISLVEDDDGLRKHIADYLESTGTYRCISAYTSVKDALQKLPGDGPQIVLMDIDLGRDSGIECVRTLKPLMHQCLFVMLTVFADTEKIFDALSAGASGYLLKHQPPAKLLEALEELLEGGAPMSPPIARKVVASCQSKTDSLSAREFEVLKGLSQGLVYKQIADRMGISPATIRTYILRVYDKLHVKSRTEAVAKMAKMLKD